MGRARWLRRGVVAVLGLAVLEAAAGLGLAVVGRWDLSWVAAFATLALATFAFGAALGRLVDGTPAARREGRAVPVWPERSPDARLERVVARRRARWARMLRQ